MSDAYEHVSVPVRTLFAAYLAVIGGQDPARSDGWIRLRQVLRRGDVRDLRWLLRDGATRAQTALAAWEGRPEAALSLLNEVTEHLAYGPALDHWQHRNVLAPVSDTLDAISADVRASAACGWWWSDVSDGQLLTEGRTCRRAPFGEPAGVERWGWWVAPDGPGIAATTRGPVGTAASVSLVCRDGHLTPVDGARTHPYDPPAGEVLEIRSVGDWARLVDERPVAVAPGGPRAATWSELTFAPGPWTEPDITGLRATYAGVHVSIGAFVDVAYAAVPVADGFTALVGWDPDATVWFDDRELPLR